MTDVSWLFAGNSPFGKCCEGVCGDANHGKDFLLFIYYMLSLLSGYYEGLGGKMEINFIVAIFAISL